MLKETVVTFVIIVFLLTQKGQNMIKTVRLL